MRQGGDRTAVGPAWQRQRPLIRGAREPPPGALPARRRHRARGADAVPVTSGGARSSRAGGRIWPWLWQLAALSDGRSDPARSALAVSRAGTETVAQREILDLTRPFARDSEFMTEN